MTRLHENELDTDVVLVRRLVARSFPDLADMPVRAISDSGSSNSLYRLGDALTVRLPRQPGGGTSITKEAAWLPYVAERLAVHVPHLVGLGSPAYGYSEVWAVTSWLPGAVPRTRAHGDQGLALAQDLARFIEELRAMPVPPGAIEDPALASYRGDPLCDFDADFRQMVKECRALDLNLDFDRALRVWDTATSAASRLSRTTHWYHGDLLGENVLLDRHGRLDAVLDFGGLALGNPEVDLVAAWDLLDAEGRAAFGRELDLDDDHWSASRGWALFLALMTFPYYSKSMPGRCASRLAMAQEVLAVD